MSTVSSSFKFSASSQPCSREKSLSKLVKFMIKCYYYTFNFSCETMFIIIIIIIIIISVFPIIIILCFQRHKQYSFCVLLFLSLLKKCSKTFKNWSKGEHMKLVAMGPVLMWFVIWHSEESRGHNKEGRREANQVQLLQCYNFTLPSP